MNINKCIKFLAFSIIVVINLTYTSFAYSQIAVNKITIDSVISDKFPQVDAQVSVTDAQGYPLQGLDETNFSLFEDGNSVAVDKVVPFTNNDQSLKIALLIDTSGSMDSGKPKPISEAVAAAKNFINSLNTNDQVALISFSDQVSETKSLTNDKPSLISALDTLKIGDQTKMYDAVVSGVDILKTQAGRKLIILITDGNDSSSKYDLNAAIDEAVRWSIPIYPIGFGNQIDHDKLDRLAQLSGGVAIYRPDATTVTDGFNTVLDVLRAQYRISFTSALAADGKQHEIRVSIKAGGVTAETTSTFTATPGSVQITLPEYQPDLKTGGKLKFAPDMIAPTGISKLEVFVDNSLINTVETNPYEVIWDTASVTPGNHLIKFVATDKAGNSGEYSLQLNIQPIIDIQIITPSEGEKIIGDIQINADVTGLAKISNVSFIIDDVELVSFSAPPYSYTIDSRKFSVEEHIVEVKATDINNNVDSKQIKVNIAYQETIGLGWIVLVLAIAAVGIIVPLSLRSRSKYKSSAGKIMSGKVASGFSGLVLTEEDGVYPGRVWQFSQQQIRLGRKKDENDIPLAGINASRQQGLIIQTPTGWVMQSLKSDNPILMNGSAVEQCQLHVGDRIQAGDSRFTVNQI
jgi:VWFA-related protein